MRKSEVKLYNILLPIWLLFLWPSPLWLILIPANYILDRIVLRWSLGDMPEKGLFCRKNTWKICIAGFASDLVGAGFLLGIFLIFTVVEDGGSAAELIDKLGYGIGFNPFSNIGAFVIIAISVAIAGALIYFLDRKILTKAGLDAEQARRSALRLALITAPYLYFVPSELLYNNYMF